jgi:hypothetical protein
MKDEAIAVIGIVAVLGLTYGLHATAKLPEMQKTKPFAEVVKTADVTQPKDDSPVVLTVNGEPITEKEFWHFVEQTVREDERPMLNSPQGGELRRLVSERLVQMKVIEQKGREMGLDQSPDVKGAGTFAEMGALMNKTLDRLVTPTEQEVRAEYAKQSAQMSTVELSHVLVAYQGGQIPARNGQALPPEQALQKAAALAAKLRGGANFEQVARAESDDTQSAAQGGHLGAVPANALGPQMTPLIASMKEGEISDPIRSPYGVHIFLVGKRTEQSFAQARAAIEQKMKQDRARDTVSRLAAAAKVDRDPKFFAEAPPSAAPVIPQKGRS